MKIDFLHIGYHKTATTWFQYSGYKKFSKVVICNDVETNLYEFFSKNFVEIPDFNFDKDSFEKSFLEELKKNKSINSSNILGICDENLTGHPWNGKGSELLASRIKEVFGDIKIIITVRNQIDMVRSLYSDYLKSGGTKSIKQLLNDKYLYGENIFKKLCYHKLIYKYQKIFSEKNVLVLTYEDLNSNKFEILRKIGVFIGEDSQNLVFKKEDEKKINLKFSVPYEILVRYLNRIGLNSNLVMKLIYKSNQFFFRKWFHSNQHFEKIIGENHLNEWKKSNALLQKKNINLNLKVNRYLL